MITVIKVALHPEGQKAWGFGLRDGVPVTFWGLPGHSITVNETDSATGPRMWAVKTGPNATPLYVETQEGRVWEWAEKG